MSQDRTKSEIQPRLFLGLVLATDTKTPSRSDFDPACKRMASAMGFSFESASYKEENGCAAEGDYILSGDGEKHTGRVSYHPGPDLMEPFSYYVPENSSPRLWPEGCGHLLVEVLLPLNDETQVSLAIMRAETMADDCAASVGLHPPSGLWKMDLAKMVKGETLILFWVEHGLCVLELIPPGAMPGATYVGCSLGWERVYNRFPKEHTIEALARLAGLPVEMGTPDRWGPEEKARVAMERLAGGRRDEPSRHKEWDRIMSETLPGVAGEY